MASPLKKKPDTEEVKFLVDLTDEERRELARTLYVESPVVRVMQIARKAGVHHVQVAEWRDCYDWVAQRLEYQHKQLVQKYSGVDVAKAPLQIYRLTQLMLDNMEAQIEYRLQRETLDEDQAARITVFFNQLLDAQKKASHLLGKKYS